MNIAQSRDFPDWIGPMLVKELRQGLKARAFEITFIALQIILVLVISYHALLYVRYGPRFDADGLHGIFWFIVGVQLLVITPLRALGSLTNERKANTLELIFMTGMSAWRIAWGKWASLFFQSLLFVLAVLPYGVLRYFFGGVNLSEDFVILGSMLVVSAGFSAIALAISGLPTFIRFGAIGLFGFAGLAFIPALLMRVVMRGAGVRAFWDFSLEDGWPLLLFNVLLLCVGALELGASTIAPQAENHALRQRLIVMSALLPIPVMLVFADEIRYSMVQLLFFACLGLAVSWLHFGSRPGLMRVHLERFSRRGPLGQFAAMFLQPGWPSAVLFLALVGSIFAVGLTWLPSKENDIPEVITVIIMAGAALMTPPLIWALFRLRTKQTLLLHTIFLGLCAGLFAMVRTLESSPTHLGVLTAALPPFGFFAMLDNGLEAGTKEIWMVIAPTVFILSILGCVILSRDYWGQMFRLSREIRNSPKREPMKLEVAA